MFVRIFYWLSQNGLLRRLLRGFNLRELSAIIQLVLVLGLTFMMAGCATLGRQFPAPDEGSYNRAQIDGFHHIRAWGDERPPFLNAIITEQRQFIALNPSLAQRADLLALSGGGADGAYGAGFLKGWTDRGDRPEFTFVTGVSTGALIAPFAFLGPKYDRVLKRFYTETKTANILILEPISVLLGGSAVGDPAPLKKIIEEEVNGGLLAAIAREHKRGRVLLIGTTNLDAQRQVIWDIGRIAASGHPASAQLVRDILLASASIPGVFPPVSFDVTIDGKRYQELHVDGGVTHEVFAYPAEINMREVERQLGVNPVKNLWLIRNKKIAAEYDTVGLKLTEIAERSISTLIKYQGRGDMEKIEKLAKRDGYKFHLTAVPDYFRNKPKDYFDPEYMSALYEVGYKDGRSGQAWQNNIGNGVKFRPVAGR